MNSMPSSNSPAPLPTQGARRVAIAACYGTFLEWYDFLTFAALAVWFGPLFFPPKTQPPACWPAWPPLAPA